MVTITFQTPKGIKHLGPGKPTFIVAEISANHLHSFERAKQIIHAAADSGADAVKLQTYTADTLTIDCDNEYFQIKVNKAWKGKTLYQLYQEAYTPWEWHQGLKDYAESLGLVMFSSPFDITAVAFLEKLNVPLYKAASFITNHIPLLRSIGSTKKPVILSCGITTKEELDLAIQTLKYHGAPQVALLHCVSSYPSTAEQMHLRAIPALAKQYHTIVGLSDHTLSTTIPAVAVGLGASIIEKHLTLARKDGGADAAFSLEPKEMQLMVSAVREAEKALGAEEAFPNKREEESSIFKPSIFIIQDMRKGEIFTEDNLRIIRPGYGLNPKFIDEIIGKKANTELKRGTPMSWSYIEE